MSGKKSQSAIEYLMTHAWALMVIALVFGVLFSLGVFSNASGQRAPPGSCVVSRPFGPGTTTGLALVGTCSGEPPQYVAQLSTTTNSFVLVPIGRINNVNHLTLSMWVRENATQKSGGAVLFTESLITSLCPIFYISGAPLSVNSWNIGYTGMWQAWHSAATVKTNQWQFLVYTLSSNGLAGTGTGNILINGTFVGTNTIQPTKYTASSQFLDELGGAGVGCVGGPVGTYNGLMANVQIYNATLSANTISAMYFEGVGGAPISLTSLVAWYPLNGDVNDYSGNQENATSNSIAYTTSWTDGYTKP